ncbi:MAG: DUF3048 domain-containing protein [Lachnospiraceae bacterium]|nr:DUF3048 domain-containing protein [Lachnospiraceae bacterium]
MKKKVLAAIIVAMGILTGCGEELPSPIISTLEPEPIATESVQESGSGEKDDATGPKEFKVITERTVVDGKMQSYLTGEWKDEAVVKRRNMAVMIPNNKPALPQYGISKASIIYEAPMEKGSCTRLMGIFEDYDDLDRIGPVRSARDYFMYESMAYDSIYCNWGLAIPYVGPVINTDRVDNVSQAVGGIDSPSSEAFDRVERGAGYAKEFTGYLFIDGYEKAVKRHDYATEYTSRFEQAFTFADEGCRAEYADCEDATTIIPGGGASNSGGYDHTDAYFEYNKDDGLYYRYQLGAPHKDEYNGEQLAVSNVIFKICYGEYRDENGYLAFRVHGEGDAYVFTNGKVIPATWERKSDYEPNMFYDKNGDEIVLNQGKTWVCIIWEDYEDCIVYK